jgi:inward rectifier potassium channel
MAGPESPPPRAPNVAGIPQLVRLNIQRRMGRDLYHLFLEASWSRVLVMIITVYAFANLLFALGYLACGDGIDNARHGSFSDAFFFSVQTMSTIGYGRMVPRSAVANTLVTIEALCGLLGFAMATGLMFSKFARPTARVMFSHVAVISNRDGVRSLMFRMANERTNQIVEAQLHVVLLRNETTVEGEFVRRFYDLPLARQATVAFTNTWTAVHQIVKGSPLYGCTDAELEQQRATIIASLLGFDETFSQTVHARHTYDVAHIVWNSRLVDILIDLPDGRRAVDYGRFHDVMPVESDSTSSGDPGPKSS